MQEIQGVDMAKACAVCGRSTNAPSGICVICSMDRVNEEINNSKSNGVKEMPKNYKRKEKKCINCGKMYQPASNGQKRCAECKENHQKVATPVARNDKKEKPRSVIARSEVPKQSQSQINGNHIVTVDFSRYLPLHERLLKLADQEFRTPELQIMNILNFAFQCV